MQTLGRFTSDVYVSYVISAGYNDEYMK